MFRVIEFLRHAIDVYCQNPVEFFLSQGRDFTYSSYPLYFDEEKPAPAFLDREILKELLPEPFDKTNQAYCVYCLSFRQTAEEDPHAESLDL